MFIISLLSIDILMRKHHITSSLNLLAIVSNCIVTSCNSSICSFVEVRVVRETHGRFIIALTSYQEESVSLTGKSFQHPGNSSVRWRWKTFLPRNNFFYQNKIKVKIWNNDKLPNFSSTHLEVMYPFRCLKKGKTENSSFSFVLFLEF